MSEIYNSALGCSFLNLETSEVNFHPITPAMRPLFCDGLDLTDNMPITLWQKDSSVAHAHVGGVVAPPLVSGTNEKRGTESASQTPLSRSLIQNARKEEGRKKRRVPCSKAGE